jgi:hypothetical protein
MIISNRPTISIGASVYQPKKFKKLLKTKKKFDTQAYGGASIASPFTTPWYNPGPTCPKPL